RSLRRVGGAGECAPFKAIGGSARDRPPVSGELVLTHFARTPFVCFGTVRVGCSKSQVLPIANPQDVPVQVVIDKFPSAKGFTANESRFVVEHDLVISWIPLNAGGVRETVTFSVGCVKIKAVFLGKAEDPPKKKRSLWDTIKRNKSSEGPVKSKKSTIMNTIASKTTISQIDTVKTGGHRNPLQSRENLSLAEDRVSPLFHPIHVLDNKGHEVKPLSPISTVSPVKQEFENCAPQSFKRSVTYSVLKTDDDMSLPVEGEPNSDGRYNVQCSAETFINEPNLVHSFKISQQILDSQTYCFPHLSGPLTPFSQRRILSPDSFVKGSYFPEGDSEPRIVAKILSPDQFLKESLAVVNVSSLHSSQEEARSLPAQSSLNPSDFQSELIQERNDESISPVHSDFPVINVRELEPVKSRLTYFVKPKCASRSSQALKQPVVEHADQVKMLHGSPADIKITLSSEASDCESEGKVKHSRRQLEVPFILNSAISTFSSLPVIEAPTENKTTDNKLPYANRKRKSSEFLHDSANEEIVCPNKRTSQVDQVRRSTFVEKTTSRNLKGKGKSKGRKPNFLNYIIGTVNWFRLCLVIMLFLSVIPRHPMPFAAKNMFFDERWKEKQERGFTWWLNFILTPDDFTVSTETSRVNAAAVFLGSESHSHKMSVPAAPTKEEMSLRSYTAKRRLNRLRRSACRLFTSEGMVKVIQKLEGAIAVKHLLVRKDRHLWKDYGERMKVLKWLLSYNTLWLRIGLETIYGELIPLENNSDVIGLGRFILNRLLWNSDVVAEYRHPTVPHLYRNEHKEVLAQFTLKKFLLLVWFLDCAKQSRLIDHDPCLFCKDAEFKSSKDLLLAFSRDFLSGEGDLCRHLSYMGLTVSHFQTPLHEFNFAITNLAVDLRCGVRIVRAVELLTQDWTFSKHLRVPTISRLQKLHNVEIALKALRLRGIDLKAEDDHVIDSRDVVDGHRERTLALLWRIIFAFQVEILLNVDHLNEEIKFLKTTLRNQQRLTALQSMSVPPGPVKDHSPVVASKDYRLQVKLLMDWVNAVCAYHGVKVENFTVPFSDGRVLCYLVHHYHPGLLAADAICQRTTQTVEFAQRGSVAIDTLSSDSDESSIDISSTTADLRKIKLFALSSSALYQELLENEKKNFHLVTTAVVELGGVPAMIRHLDMSNTIPDEKVVIAYLSFLCARLLDLRKETRAARLIQAAWRKYKVSRENQAACVIQAAVCRFLYRQHFKKKTNATIIIQAHWQGYVARRKAKQLRMTKVQAVQNAAATVIQVCLKFLVCDGFTFCRYSSRRQYQNLLHCCILMQKHIRRKIAVTSYRQMLRATVGLQRCFRAHLLGSSQRREYLKLKLSAIVIQAAFRKWSACKLEATIKASIILQKYIRGFLCRKQYKKYQKSITLIQAFARGFLVRAKMSSRKNAAIIIQKYMNAYLAGKQDYVSYHRLKWAAIVFQAAYRGLKVRNTYRQIKSAIVIQSLFRMHLQRKKFVAIQKAAVTVQSSVRMKLVRIWFLKYRQAAITVQRHYRTKEQGRKERRRYVQLRQATITIQAAFNRWQTQKWIRKNQSVIAIQSWYRMCREKRSYLHQRRSCIRVQSWYRCCRAKQTFLIVKRSALFIQEYYRAYHRGKAQVEKYQSIRQGTITIQAYFRGMKARRLVRKVKAAYIIQSYWQTRKERLVYLHRRQCVIMLQAHVRRWQAQLQYKTMRTAVCILQAHVKALLKQRKAQSEYKAMRFAAIVLQSNYRGRLARRQLSLLRSVVKIQSAYRAYVVRRRFSQIKKAAIIIQAYVKMIQVQKRYRSLKNAEACICLQSAVRQYLIKKQMRLWRQAAIRIQSKFRMHRQRRQYLRIYCAAVIIQRGYLAYSQGFCQRQKFLRIREAAICLQAAYKGYMVRKIIKLHCKAAITLQAAFRRRALRIKYQAMQNASIAIQRWYRTCKVGQQQRAEYRKIRSGTILLQALYRGFSTRKKIKVQHEAAKTIQTAFRRFRAQKQFAMLKDAVLTIQQYFKAKLAGDKQRQVYLRLCQSAAVLQAAYKGMLVRKEIKRKRQASIVIQSYFRMHQMCTKFKSLKSATLVIQDRFRAYLQGKRQRQRYQKMKNAAVLLQAAFHAMKARKKMKEVQKAASIIQTAFRSYNTRKRYLSLQAASTLLQRKFRALLLAKQQRKHYLCIQGAVLTIQSAYRGMKTRQEILHMHWAATVIQSTFRMHKVYIPYQATRLAAIIIQVHYRAHVESKAERENYLKIRHSVVVLQAALRGMNVRKHLSCMHKSATVIQASYRMQRQRYWYKRLYWAAVVIQQQYRACKIRDACVQQYTNVRNAVICIQTAFHSMKTRQEIQRLEQAIIVIQGRFRAYNERKKYLALKDAATTIQQQYRGLLLARIQRQQYLSVRNAAICFQATYRGKRMRQAVRSMHLAAIVIQSTFRMHQVYVSYQATRLAAIIIQVRYRAHVEGKTERENYLKIRHSVVVLQAALRGMNVRKHLSCMHKSAILIQSFYRMHRQLYLYKRLCWAAVVIQQRYRACKVRDIQVQQYGRMKKAIVHIQALYRGKKARRLSSAIILQATFRGYRARVHYRTVRNAAVSIQHWYRACKMGQSQLIEFQAMKRAAISIQAVYKGVIARRWYKQKRAAVKIQSVLCMMMHRKRFLQIKSAAISIQSQYHAYKARKLYKSYKGAAVILQRHFKSHLMRKEQRLAYLTMQQKIIFLQSAIRGFIVRRNYEKLQKSTKKIQALFRGHQARQLVNKMQAARKIQAWFRASVVRKRYKAMLKSVAFIHGQFRIKQERSRFLKVRTATITIQQGWRRTIEMQKAACQIQHEYRGYKERKKFLGQKLAVLAIQRLFRAWQLEKNEKLKHEKRTRAAVILQAVWRGLRVRKEVAEQQFAAKRRCFTAAVYHHLCAVKIQRTYRSYVALKFAKEKIKSVICIQRWFRTYLQRCNYLKERQQIIAVQRTVKIWLKRRNKAAVVIQQAVRRFLDKMWKKRFCRRITTIQAMWKGYYLRKKMANPRIIAIRCRIQQATEKSSEEQKLGNRTAIALNYILKYKHFSWILAALQHLEVATRLSSLCCENFAKSGATPIIFTLIRSCNRSVPSMDIIKYAIQVLLNVSKYEKTSGVVYEVKNSITILIDLLQMYREKAGDKTADKCGSIFTKVCCLLSILSQDSQKALEVRSMPRAQDRIHTIYKLTLRKHKMDTDREIKQRLNDPLSGSFFIPATPVRTKVVSRLKPDWVLRRDNMKEIVDPLKAIQLVMDTLGISTNL
uniref:Assembly factor for spindle microtubules n=1 Tax=Callorhinchus milii TaxID=7868 RepID=A0A4W3JTQ1_CALMI